MLRDGEWRRRTAGKIFQGDAATFTLTGSGPAAPDLVFRQFTELGGGTYTFVTTSQVAATFTLSATVDEAKLTQQPTVQFTAGEVCVNNCEPVDPAHVTGFTVVTDGMTADGSAADVVEAHAYDHYGNPVANAAVVIADQTTTTSPENLTGKLTPGKATATTGADGTVRTSFTTRIAGTYTAQGSVNGLLPPASNVITLHFTPGEVNAGTSQLSVTPAKLAAGQPATAQQHTRSL